MRLLKLDFPHFYQLLTIFFGQTHNVLGPNPFIDGCRYTYGILPASNMGLINMGMDNVLEDFGCWEVLNMASYFKV